MNFEYKKKSRGSTSMSQIPNYIKHIAYTKTAFCDASIRLEGYQPVEGILAAWSAQDFSFVTKPVVFPCEFPSDKKAGVDALELMAIRFCSEAFPDHFIRSDSRNACGVARLMGIAEPEWIPRELNTLADFIAKSKIASGYIVFNSPQPSRGWIFLESTSGGDNASS